MERGHGGSYSATERRYRSTGEHHGSNCESVYKRAEVDGRLATIGGTRCYNEHGDAYIVPESRYVVEYHEHR